MPLPDERPRQSVANLIGRFETQTKRISQISTGSPSRSSSVVSHITGDSTKEESKERREWPPKPVVELEKPPLVLPSRQIPPALITQSSSAGSDLSSNNKWKKEASGTTTEEAEIPLTAKSLNASLRQNQGEPDSFLENWRKEISSQVNMEPEATPTAPEAPHSSQPTPIPGAAQKLALPTTSRTTNVTKTTKTIATPSSKAPASTVSKPPVKATLRTSTSKTPITPATPKPLKPQHTGQSVASNTSRKPAPKVPTTPLKAPLRPDAAGSKTPTSAVRPKTPSSGLFAPTAASLARSRSAAPPVPQIASPPKKLVSSTSMDRLSKPTAASKAKTAATPAAMPSVRPTATGPRASAVKPKVPATPDKTVKKREPISSKGTSKPKAATGAVVAAVVAGVGAATTLLVEDEGKTSDKAEEPEYSSVNGLEAKSDSSPNDEHVGGKTEIDVEASTSSASVLEEVHSERGVANEEHIETEDKQSVGSGNIELSPGSHSPVIEVSGEVVSDAGEPTEPQAERKDDLADIVNLLESVSITKDGEEAVDIPEEIQEIPEENDK